MPWKAPGLIQYPQGKGGAEGCRPEPVKGGWGSSCFLLAGAQGVWAGLGSSVSTWSEKQSMAQGGAGRRCLSWDGACFVGRDPARWASRGSAAGLLGGDLGPSSCSSLISASGPSASLDQVCGLGLRLALSSHPACWPPLLPFQLYPRPPPPKLEPEQREAGGVWEGREAERENLSFLLPFIPALSSLMYSPVQSLGTEMALTLSGLVASLPGVRRSPGKPSCGTQGPRGSWRGAGGGGVVVVCQALF